ncbi:ATP synthase F0 subunit 8 (mitochondrion) [Rhinatrema bivittatum]|uniref:ATP synthase complex subunit 8 n=1 Tax=Rhinatrema bivittatum TaxID=194408 RepID=Q64JR7_RHIBI|nr:ATP synthase F0 subunit 8 [Rhinatrema bivittatum]AAS13722.1 ATP synthase F0 subunit 8 [Rhinatrema bivittatum]
MPQLNPGPWFTIMLFSWLIFLLIPAKMIKHQQTNLPTDQEQLPHNPWTWPWS